jgi:hypothetical protein
MPRMSRNRIAIAALIVAILIAASLTVYGIDEGFGGLAIWNQSEAYLFFQVGSRGNRASYLGYLWILFKEHVIGGFAGAVIPDDSRASLIVIHVTALSVERNSVKMADFITDNTSPVFEKYTPLGGQIYVLGPELLLWRWAGDHFEKATQEEQERLDGIHRLTIGDFYNDANGWSRRGFGVDPAERDFTMDVGNELRLAVNHQRTQDAKNDTLAIYLQRPGKVSERIAVFEKRHGNVSRAEYQHALRDPE